MKHENLWLSVQMFSVKCTDDLFNLDVIVSRDRGLGVINVVRINIAIHLFVGTVVEITNKLLSLLLSEDFLDNTNWLIILRRPWSFEKLSSLVYNSLINEVLVGQSAELIEPSFAYDFSFHSCSESTLSQLVVFILVSKGANSSFDSSTQLMDIVMLHCET
jgi:hypothetical protein